MLSHLHASAQHTRDWIVANSDDPLLLLRALKFEEVGLHPVENRPLNVIEQLNQTFTYAVAFAAASQLFNLHPDLAGLKIAPGAHMALPLDIMSIEEGLIGAETFAAVDYRNNRKLTRDLDVMALRNEQHRYVFFASPTFPTTERQIKLERHGVQVWSVEI